MSKTVLWAVVAVVVLGGGYLLIHHKAPEQNPAMQGGTSAPLESLNPDADAGKKVPFSEFVKNNNGSYKCTVQQSMSDTASEGTVYISGGNVAGSFNTVAEGRPMDTSFVLKDGYSYTWSSALPGMGFKVKVTAAAGDASASASGTYSWNADQIGDYDCQPWTADQSKFALPTGITFRDMTSASAQ